MCHPTYVGCGLKSLTSIVNSIPSVSPYICRVWIEIFDPHTLTACRVTRHPTYVGCGLKYKMSSPLII